MGCYLIDRRCGWMRDCDRLDCFQVPNHSTPSPAPRHETHTKHKTETSTLKHQANCHKPCPVVRHPFPPVQHPPLTQIHECWLLCPLRLHNPTASNKVHWNLNYNQHQLFLPHHKKHNIKPLLFPPNILLLLPCTFENGLLRFLDLKNRVM